MDPGAAAATTDIDPNPHGNRRRPLDILHRP